MTKDVTINIEDFIKQQYQKLNELEDLASTFPVGSKIRKSTMNLVELGRRGLREFTVMLFRTIQDEFPDSKINDSYDLFTNFELTLVVRKLDVPNIKFKN